MAKLIIETKYHRITHELLEDNSNDELEEFTGLFIKGLQSVGYREHSVIEMMRSFIESYDAEHTSEADKIEEV